MSHELPDDVTRWPSDPYALLGVERGASLRDLKKAYARLLRRYRPEDNPDGFRRIRDAFELLQQELEWFGSAGVPVPADNAAEPSPPPDGDTSNRGTTIDIAAPLREQTTDEVTVLWQRAGEDREGAYRALRELNERRPQDAEVPLRLYWLLRLQPDLDRVRQPIDWLTDTLLRSNLAHPSCELYRRHLLEFPAEALSPRCDQLIHCDAVAFRRSLVLEWRWRALARLGHLEMIENDRERLRSRLLGEDEASWVHLLLGVMGELAWSHKTPQRNLLVSLLDEIESLVHLHSRFAEEFARLDFLLEVSRAWQDVQPGEQPRDRQMWEALLNLVWQHWTCSPIEARPQQTEFLDRLLVNPRQSLRFLDDVLRRAPILLSQLGAILHTLEFGYFAQPTTQAASAELDSVVERFVNRITEFDPSSLRMQVLEFCLKEFLPPEVVVETIARNGLLPDPPVYLFEDWPLRYVCQSSRIFWSA